MKKCDCCGKTQEEELDKRGWGFACIDSCKECGICFPMIEIFIDVSHGLRRNTQWSRRGDRTPIIMENGCTVFRNGGYVTIKDVFEEFEADIVRIAATEGFRRRLVEEFCLQHGFYIEKMQWPMIEKKDRIDQKDGTYVLNAVMSNEGYPDSKWKFVSGTLHDANGVVLGHKEPIDPEATETQ